MTTSNTENLRVSWIFWILSYYFVLISSTNETITYNKPLNQTISTRIIGGDFVSIRGAPFVVNLRYDGKFICGGSLLRQNCVLTAAHCVIGTSADHLRVQGGTTILSNTGQISRVQKIFIPRRYNKKTQHFDVAILQLANPLKGKRVKTVNLSNDNARPGQRVRVYGWGMRREDGKRALAMRAAMVRIIERRECARDFREEGRLSRTMMCASVRGTEDSCDGDSGGPLMFRGSQYGIVSWGIGCGRVNFPGIYTDIKAVHPWIKKIVARHCN